VLLLAAPVMVLMICTAQGERRRGSHVLTAAVAGLFFPLAWAVWYVRDEFGAPPSGAVPTREL